MTRKLEIFLERLETTSTVDDLSSLADILRDTYDVKNVSYLATNLNGLPFVSSTYDLKWAQHYEEQNYMLIDPVVRGALLQFNPLDWKRLDWSSKRTRGFFNEAIDFGVGQQGYTVPIRGPNGQAAIFAINHDSNDVGWERYIGEHAHDFMLISHYFHQKTLTATHTTDPVDGRDLSPRELDVLKYLGIGLSRGKVAEVLKISEHTLRVYVDSARYKLGALNTTHAVAIALARGVIAV